MTETICFIDLETTGADIDRAEVLEMGLYCLDADTLEPTGHEAVFRYHAMTTYYEDGARNLHHLDAEEGDDPAHLVRDVVDFHRSTGVQGVLYPAGHNVLAFDIPLLRKALRHEWWTKTFHYRARDTAVIARFLADARRAPRLDKFGDIAAHFGVTLTDYHRALPDAKDESAVYAAMARRNMP